MSGDLLRQVFKKPPPLPYDPDLDDLDDEAAAAQELRSGDMLPPLGATTTRPLSFAKGGGAGGAGASGRYAPLEWSEFFETKRTIPIYPSTSSLSSSSLTTISDSNSGRPHETRRGQEESTDSSAASTSREEEEGEEEPEIVFNVYETRGKPGSPLFVLHHGAAHCGLSFALTADRIRALAGDSVSILAFDMRGHGETRSKEEYNLSLERLATDLKNVLEAAYDHQLPDEIVLVGHSAGGSVVAEAASRNMIPNVLGVALLDIVESFAIEALANIHGWLERRPNQFRSLDKVIQWGVKSGTVRNLESARVSFPGMVVRKKPESTTSSSGGDDATTYLWRTDLLASEKYWELWFTGLTAKFLSIKTAKLLVLAGTDRLDKDMTIAQMQGKFQLLVFPNSGHAVQEDEPGRMAQELLQFLKRNERLVLPSHPFMPQHSSGGSPTSSSTSLHNTQTLAMPRPASPRSS
ncbi:Protein with carboxyl methyl esterase activity [Actinomortierella ambigua]|uniref:Protein phosphatase methylesterase 1 n=1 Tax=Actinomortierella ambigua TaxID=1343610 RepID=A0A9P6TYL0_9FUNG|nr:Protein with carboxyl methyl esterase activity [Actinomortierella ambigua]